MSEKIQMLNEKAKEIRKLTIQTIGELGVGHIGGALSLCEALSVLYFDAMHVDPADSKMPDRDRFVLSKGHGGPAVYATLALKGFIPMEELHTLNRPNTHLPSHCDMRLTNGIDMSTGSLGQGFSAATGMALAAKMDQKDLYVYAIIGDGESQEGQIWEAAMLAGSRKLDNFIAFTDYNGLNAPDWVGLQNFATMFWEDDKFWLSFKITLKFAIVQVPLKLIFALLVALLLSRGSKGVGAYRVAFYVPSVLGGSVAVAMTWKILWGVNGPVNGLLNLFGIEPVNFLKDTRTALYVLILLGVWQFGSSMLIFLAGIKDIPQIYYEAAIMDGANSVQRFLKITLPLLTPCIFFNLVNGIIGSLQAFNSAYLVTNGGPLNSTLYYGLNLYNQAFNYGKFGYASAMAWFMLLIIVALTALVFRSSSGWVFYQNDQD